jgi:mono/diheme cytochrome c family protein
VVRGPFIIWAILSVGLVGCGRNRSTEFKIPPEAAHLRNPLPVTRESIAAGNELYRSAGCAICHGKNGDGKGVLAKDVSMNLHNWRDPAFQASLSDGELFYVVEQGKGTNRGRMPAYKDQETSEQIWDMVIYVRSLASLGGSN